MSDTILSTIEIDLFISDCDLSKLEDIGKKRWFNKSSTFIKLYQIATLEASTECDHERIKDSVYKYGKIELFIKELITLSIWKEKVLPELLLIKPEPQHTLPVYIILYNEVVLVGLLQSLLYHSELFRDINESCIDLIDYCVKQLIQINPKDVPIVPEMKLDCSALEDVDRHDKFFKLVLTTQCPVILRYICENIDTLPINVASRIYTTHDIPVLIAQLLDKEVWTKRMDDNDGKIYKFSDKGWTQWTNKDPPLSKTEVQVWLLMRQLIMNDTVRTVYTFSDYRREQLTRLTRLLNDSVMDQLHPLAELKYWLHANSIIDTTSTQSSPRITNPLIIDVTYQFQDKIYTEYKGKWKEIAYERSKLLFYADRQELLYMSNGFGQCLDHISLISDSVQTCMNCQGKAVKRCSKCKKAWYCSRNCQVEHWSAHKSNCQ